MLSLNSLIEEIDNIEYLSKCCNNKEKDFNSLSYLIDDKLSQSECIKMGKLLEEYISNIILKYTNNKNIKPKNKKGYKEKDHLFINENDKIVYYAELKSNLNLDTEKSKSTYNKCLDIVNELKIEYKDYNIKWCLLGIRYIDKTEIPKNIINKYKKINEHVYGINDYFKLIGINFKFNNNDYKLLINNIAIKAFKK